MISKRSSKRYDGVFPNLPLKHAKFDPQIDEDDRCRQCKYTL
jgi:hypothetical protein